MKNSYILLRNNKETGPFSFEQLREQGLAAGDLLWVEGQSVAWMRPAELPEFRSANPGHTKIRETEDTQVSKETEKYQPVPENISVQKSSVYVSLPTAYDMPQETAATFAKTDPGPVEAEPALSTKFERPLDEIKEMYVRTLESRKKKTARKKHLRKYLKYAAIFIGLPLAGAFVAISLQKKDGKSGEEEIVVRQPAQESVVPDESVTSNLPDQQNELYVPSAIAEDPRVENHERPGAVSVPMSTVKDPPIEEPATERKPEQHHTAGKEDAATLKNENKPVVQVPQEEVAPFVAVKSNAYKTGSFGGIRDLQLTLTNDSKYNLSQVAVELQYLKLGDEIVKSEMINFQSVPPNSSQTLEIPDNKRGVRIAYKVRRISAERTPAGF